MIKLLQLASLFSLPVLALTVSCTESKAHSGPSEYDLKSPIIHKMDSKLAEISGIAFKPGVDATLYAIEDEHANFYRLSAGGKIEGTTDFGKKGDYEDLAITSSAAFVLRSDGTILRSDIPENHAEIAATVAENILPKGEYEGMAAGPNSSLVVLCKECKGKSAKSKLILYKISINDSNQLQAPESVSVEIGKENKADKKSKIAPSGLARNPVNGNWYIISSVNKSLIVLKPDFSSPVIYDLDPKMFAQPEGICFDTKGTLFISNEAAGGTATILEFKRK